MQKMATIQAPIVVTGVSGDDYMAHYAHDFYEWVRGTLIKMSPVTKRHNQITRYLDFLLDTYFSLRPIGEVMTAPFVMRVDATESRREPDLQIILKDNPGELTDTAMIGAADICIEVVSAESAERDHSTKLVEYEKGGVREYWIIDPAQNESRFLRLVDGRYVDVAVDDQENYRTPLLPDFGLHVPTLWQETLPAPPQIVNAIQEMLRR